MTQIFRIALLLAIAPSAACAAEPTAAVPAGSMQAIVYSEYGTPEVLRLSTVERPVPEGKQVLVRIHAASVNPVDWHTMLGKPYIVRFMSGWTGPKDPWMGTDLAGEVIAVGPEVTRFKVGDAVFGVGPSAFAEYSLAAERRLAPKPAAISWEQAAAVPVAAITALQALRDHGRVRAGHKVLVNGASGGVGTNMVQLARLMGAEVTAVCSGRNAELVRSLGADHVVDYTQEDFTGRPGRYDVILDNVGNHGLSDLRRVLAPDGTIVSVGAKGREVTWGFSFLAGAVQRKLLEAFTDQRFASFMAEVLAPDLEYLAGLMEQGRLRAVIDRRYPLSATAEAMRYLGKGHARGKIIIEIAAQ